MPQIAYWNEVINALYSGIDKIDVKTTFHGQMKQIRTLLKNDKTGLIARILNFQIQCANVDFTFNSIQPTLTKLFDDVKKNVNAGLGMDIPRGFRSLSEQYYRERLTSSFIVTEIRWGKKEGYIVPEIIFFYDGASIYADNIKGNLNSIKYYFGKPGDDNRLVDSDSKTILIRKPYNAWTDIYPTPYLVKMGALYHGLKKSAILDRQAEIINTAFPYQFIIKAGTEEMIRQKLDITEKHLSDLADKFKNQKTEAFDNPKDKGFIGAFPFHVNFEELIPDYAKALDEKVLKGTDKDILSSLGLIELKGFSSTREEAILNPKVLVEEVIDSVLDFKELWEEITRLTIEKNINKYKLSDEVIITPGVIEAFVTDDMRTMIRSWYDRGIVGMKDALESSTPLDFKTQVVQREQERKEKLLEKMYCRVIQNQESSPADMTPNDNVPDDKKKNTPESKNFKQANEESIIEPMSSVENIPQPLRAEMSDEEQVKFVEVFNQEFARLTELKMDNFLREKNSIAYAVKQVMEYVEAPYTKQNYPPQLKNLPIGARNLWIRVWNRVFKNTGNEDTARKAAWNIVDEKYKKVGDSWVKR
jgi:cation transport regulator ChaB